MKICESCGYQNWKVDVNDKKKPVCSECDKVMSESGQSRPVVGSVDRSTGGYVKGIIPLSDDL